MSAAVAVTAAPEVANADTDLLSMLAVFHEKLGSHLKTDDETPALLKKMENEVLATSTAAAGAEELMKYANKSVENLALISPNWRNRKNMIAKQLILLYVAIVCVDKSSAADREKHPQATAASAVADEGNDAAQPSADTGMRGCCLPLVALWFPKSLMEHTERETEQQPVKSDLFFRINLLRNSNELLNFYGDATDAQWVAMPIYRLLLEVLYSLSAPAVLKQMRRGKQNHGANLKAVLHNLCRIKEENCVLARLVAHAAKGITSMMVDHQRNTAVAVATVIVGAAKSALTMKVDSQLLDGLHKSAVCGFEMFKHYKASEQFGAIKGLCPSLPSVSALVDYADLVAASKRAESSFENWLLMSAYINNLMKIAFTALRVLSRDGKDTTAIKILRASLVGDSYVLGVCAILRRLRKRKRRRFTRPDELLPFDVVQGAFLNAEAVLSALRQRAMEGFGEVIESVENKGMRLLENTFESHKRLFEGKVLEEASRSPQSLHAADEGVTKLLGGVKAIRAWIYVFLKATKKAVNHMRSLDHTIDLALEYAKALVKYGPDTLAETEDAAVALAGSAAGHRLAKLYKDLHTAQAIATEAAAAGRAGKDEAKRVADIRAEIDKDKERHVGWRQTLKNNINDKWMRSYVHELKKTAQAGGGPAMPRTSESDSLLSNDGFQNAQAGGGPALPRSTESDSLSNDGFQKLHQTDTKLWLDWACHQAEQAEQQSPIEWFKGAFNEQLKTNVVNAVDEVQEKVLLSILLLDQTKFLLNQVLKAFEESRQRVEMVNELLGGDKRRGKKGVIDGLKELRIMLQPQSRNSLIAGMRKKIKKRSVSSGEEEDEEALPKKVADLRKQLKDLFARLQGGEQALFPNSESGNGLLPGMVKAGGFVLHFAIDAIGRAERTFSDLADMSADDVHLLSSVVSLSPADLAHGLKDRFQKGVDEGRAAAKKKTKMMADTLQSEINGAVRAAAGTIRSTLKELNVLASDADGWGVTIADLWTNMADDATAFGIIREGLQTYFGPGPRPELVEESALLVCLELQPLLQQLLQEVVNAYPSKDAGPQDVDEQRKRSIEDLHSALHLTMEATSAEIFSSRTTSPHANVQQLFYVAEYRPLVQYTVQSNWQAMGDAVMESHIDALAEENALKDKFDDYLNTLGGDDDGGIIDKHQVAAAKSNKNAVDHCQLKVLKNKDRINATETALKEDLGGGPTGVAGLVTSALLKLTDVSYQIDRVHEKVAVSLRAVDKKCDAQTAYLDGIERLFDPDHRPPKLTPLEAADRRNFALAKTVSEQNATIDKLQEKGDRQEGRIRDLQYLLWERKLDANKEDDLRRREAMQDSLEYEKSRLENAVRGLKEQLRERDEDLADADVALRGLDESNARAAALKKRLAEEFSRNERARRGSVYSCFRRPRANPDVQISDADIEEQRQRRETVQKLERKIAALERENTMLKQADNAAPERADSQTKAVAQVKALENQLSKRDEEIRRLRKTAADADAETAAALEQTRVALVEAERRNDLLERANRELTSSVQELRDLQGQAAQSGRSGYEGKAPSGDPQALTSQAGTMQNELDAATAEVESFRALRELDATILEERNARIKEQQVAIQASEQNLQAAVDKVKSLQDSLHKETDAAEALKEWGSGFKRKFTEETAKAGEWERKHGAAVADAERLRGDLEEERRRRERLQGDLEDARRRSAAAESAASAAECSNCARLQEDMRALQTQAQSQVQSQVAVAVDECSNCARLQEDVRALQTQVEEERRNCARLRDDARALQVFSKALEEALAKTKGDAAELQRLREEHVAMDNLKEVLEDALEKAQQDAKELQSLREEKRRREEAARQRQQLRDDKELNDLQLSFVTSPSHYNISSKLSTKGGALSRATRFKDDSDREDVPTLLSPRGKARSQSPSALSKRADRTPDVTGSGLLGGGSALSLGGFSSLPPAVPSHQGRTRQGQDFSRPR